MIKNLKLRLARKTAAPPESSEKISRETQVKLLAAHIAQASSTTSRWHDLGRAAWKR